MLYCGALLADLHAGAGRGDLAPHISQRQRPLATRKWNPRCAGDLAHILVAGADFGSRLGSRRRISFHFEADKHAMHVAARANALHDLLPDVAAFGEVQRVLLAGLLRQIAFSQIDAEARHAA